jgi:hypothetical protein
VFELLCLLTNFHSVIIQYQQELEGKSQPVSQYDWSLLQFPQPQISADSGIVPIFLLAAIMFNYVTMARAMVTEVCFNLLLFFFFFFFLPLFFFLLSFLPYIITLQKETRLKEGMRMMGMAEFPYWSSWFAHYTVVMVCTIFILFIAGYIFSFKFFTRILAANALYIS